MIMPRKIAQKIIIDPANKKWPWQWSCQKNALEMILPKNVALGGNLLAQVIIYGGIQQDGIVLSVHTKTVNTSMNR